MSWKENLTAFIYTWRHCVWPEEREKLAKTMCSAHMENISKATIYSEGVAHLFSEGFDCKQLGVDTDNGESILL